MMAHTFHVPGRPKSKERPRLGRRRKAYTPEATVLAEEAIARAYAESDGPLFDGPVHVFVTYTAQGQTITIREAPDEAPVIFQGDIDNLLKTTLDGLQRPGGALLDDKQVRKVEAHKIKVKVG